MEIQFVRNVTDGNWGHATGVPEKLPDLDEWEFIEAFYPNYQRCDDIMYEDDLACFVDGEIDREELTSRQHTTEHLTHDEIVQEAESYRKGIKMSALGNFYEMVKEGKITIISTKK